jgi:hypothetical protein
MTERDEALKPCNNCGGERIYTCSPQKPELYIQCKDCCAIFSLYAISNNKDAAIKLVDKIERVVGGAVVDRKTGEQFSVCELDTIRAALQSPVPDMVLVPREPTEEMIFAASGKVVAFKYTGVARGYVRDLYTAMISAAQKGGGDETDL